MFDVEHGDGHCVGNACQDMGRDTSVVRRELAKLEKISGIDHPTENKAHIGHVG